MPRDQRVAEAESGGGESVDDARIDAAGVRHAFPRRQVVGRHGLPAHHQGEPLAVVDVLHEGPYDLAGPLEILPLVEASQDLLQLICDPVVQSGPDRVHDGQSGLFVDPLVA